MELPGIEMDRRDLGYFNQFVNKCQHSIDKSPVWIIEHAWANGMMDILEGVDPCLWPEVDLGSLTLKEAWELRVAAARSYAIVRTRDVSRFQGVIQFLEATHRLLPRLVVAIKHMKIMFGLKTIIIMRMLQEDQGCFNIVLKTNQFFPSKLPQYQDQCSSREMFLMRKNQRDFKAFAQSLALDKTKLEIYVKDLMDRQYGEHYVQKVEERLIHYLQQIEAAVAQDTYLVKLLRREQPRTREEQLLLEMMTGSTHSPTSLRRLLRCALASTSRSRPSSLSQQETTGRGTEGGCTSSSSSKAPLYASSHAAVHKPVGGRILIEEERRKEEAARDLFKDSPLLFEDEEEKEEEEEEGKFRSEEELEDELEEAVERTEIEFDRGALETDEANGSDEENRVSRTQEEEEEREAGQQEEEEEREAGQQEEEEEREAGQQEEEEEREAGQQEEEEEREAGQQEEEEEREAGQQEEEEEREAGQQEKEEEREAGQQEKEEEKEVRQQEEEEEREAGQQEDVEEMENRQRSIESVLKTSVPPLQLCSRHQRWVRNILRACSECSEDPQLQRDVNTSPVLLLSSSSTSSLQDLTPSLLIPAPSSQQTSTSPRASDWVSPQTTPMDKPCSGPAEEEPLPRLSTSIQVAAPSLPTEQKPGTSCDKWTSTFHPELVALTQAQLVAVPDCNTSGNEEATTLTQTMVLPNSTNTTYNLTVTCPPPTARAQSTSAIKSEPTPHPRTHKPPVTHPHTSPPAQPPPAPVNRLPTSQRPLTRLSRKSREASTAVPCPQAPRQTSHNRLPEQCGEAPTQPPGLSGQTATPQPGTQPWHRTTNLVPLSNKPSSEHAPHPRPSLDLNPPTGTERPPTEVPHAVASVLSPLSGSHAQAQSLRPPLPQTPPHYAAAVSPISASDGPEVSRNNRTQLRLSLPSQRLLLRSRLLQPCVRLTRLSHQEWSGAAAGRCSLRFLRSVEEEGGGVGGGDEDDEEEEGLQPRVRLTRLSHQECFGATAGRCSLRFLRSVEEEGGGVSGGGDDEEEEEGEEEHFSQLDVNTLYSSEGSLSSEDEEPDYIPHVKRTYSSGRQLAARGLKVAREGKNLALEMV